MGIEVPSKRGIFVEMNVVPLIDILLVLLVIFTVIPHKQTGLKAELPQAASRDDVQVRPEPIVIEVLADASLKINGERVEWEALRERLEKIFDARAYRVAFVRGDRGIEFQVVARVIDIMTAAGVSSVGLMTPGLEKSASAD